MKQQVVQNFLKTINKYNAIDLISLMVLCSNNFLDTDETKEMYEGSMNLFARILASLNFVSKNEKVDFMNENECNIIFNNLLTYLKGKYDCDCAELSECVNKNKISFKQFLYEISSPKTYPKTFVKSILFKMKPLETFLFNQYNLSLNQLQIACEAIMKQMLMEFSSDDIINHNFINITKYLPIKLYDDLIDINQKYDNLLDINANSKLVCFPVIKSCNMFYLTSPEVFIDNFYKCIQRLYSKKATKEEKDILSNQKGQMFNDSCEQIFKSMGFNDIYSNYKYSNGEIDLLIEDKDVLIIVECKARNYTDKTSGLSTSFIKANEHNLDNAAGQVHRFIDLLNKKETVTLQNENKKIKVSIDKYKYIIPIVLNIDNLAEINADFDQRKENTIYVSFDDLLIIADVVRNKRWLLIDFFYQLVNCKREDAVVDDIIDMFAFYCQCKNLSILFEEKLNVIVYKLGNDYFQDYFSYNNDINPIELFDNDINSFQVDEKMMYENIIEKYHSTYWKTISNFK